MFRNERSRGDSPSSSVLAIAGTTWGNSTLLGTTMGKACGAGSTLCAATAGVASGITGIAVTGFSAFATAGFAGSGMRGDIAGANFSSTRMLGTGAGFAIGGIAAGAITAVCG